jgi:hypothetical protein
MLQNHASFAVLSSDELDLVAAGVTSSQLRDVSGALTSIGVAAALVGAEPVAAAAFAGAATSIEIASLMDVFS